MNQTKKTIFMLLMAALPFTTLAKVAVKGNLDKYMAAQSLVWEQLPRQWNEGAFVGNGRIGMMVYADSADNSLTLWLGRPDVTDHRKAPNRATSLGVKGASVMTDFCRMDLGKMKLYPDAKILDGNFVLDIWQGEIRGTLRTSRGNIYFTAYTPASNEVNVLNFTTDVSYRLKLLPGSPRSCRLSVYPNLKKDLPYEDNPPVQSVASSTEGYAVHRLNAGGDYATYWKETKDKKANTATLYIASANAVPQYDISLPRAKKAVEQAEKTGFAKLRKQTNQWWNTYFRSSLICLPDKKMENFYYIQMYKLATCSSPDGPVIDNLGVCYKPTAWPGVWWNLNVQLTYMATHATNRLEQGVNFQTMMDKSFIAVLNANDPAKVGDFAWALYIYYSYMRHAGNTQNEIAKKVIPMAEAVLKLYLPHLIKENNGSYTLHNVESPEYEGFAVYDNSNYNLANMRWILQTLRELGVSSGASKEKIDYWKMLEDKLPANPVDENGMMIASNKPVAKSHRHYSHLLSFYPLRLQNSEDAETRALLEKSIDHWLTIGRGSGLAGYSYTGAASLYAFLGNGDKAYARLSHFLNKPIGLGLLLPNTLYTEGQGKNPVIETPLSAATATAEMLLQSWGEVIRPFPAIPASWQDCSFTDLRAEGGFLVSGCRKQGKLQWVAIRSEAGNPCHIKLKEWNSVYTISGSKVPVKKIKHDVYEIGLKRGETVVLSSEKGTKAEFSVTDASITPTHWYGVKKGKGLPRITDWSDHCEQE